MDIEIQTTPAAIIRKSLGLFLIIFLFTGTVFSGLTLAFYYSVTKTTLNNLKEKEQFEVDLQFQALNDTLSSIEGDILFLSQQNELHKYLLTGDTRWLDELASEYISIATQKHIYDQIRFLDSSGMEIVRVNENSGNPAKVPFKELQLKQDRYYFKDCLKMGKEEIYISPFDLNIEHGRIDIPHKPMIRLGTPVFDQTGKKRGIVLANYYGQKLLDTIMHSEPVSEGQTMLLNGEGYWLLNPKPELEWGFMFHDKQRTLAVTDPTAWLAIGNTDQGEIETPKGIYTFKTVYPLKTMGSRSSIQAAKGLGDRTDRSRQNIYHWHLVSFLSTEKIAALGKSVWLKFLIIGAGLLMVNALGTLVIAFAITKQKIYRSQLQVMALFDPLTNLPNRILFFDRLRMAAEHSRRYASKFALLYIDLDGFKQVNDSLGHEAGDELLTIVSHQLLKASRKSDTVARLAGDEFAVIYAGLDSLQALDSLAKRIINSFTLPVELTAGRATIGASIGIAFFPDDSDDVVKLVNLADKAMYVSKQHGKNRYTLAGSEVPAG
ncbi:sensor domain-containing diguanylate cyclase [Desulfopila sp. IMCC35006]|uniref:sensor domain-containing diguanylate cyclase n=1 Tax=Desulfopila sp. IMCC35006 TaxID=2569542 RepID=UPI00142E9DE1|nr:sensor domain-containing diguanylate cyclase [Desulfopila sp. IMCC35006]